MLTLRLIKESLIYAISALTSNKLRTFLSLLGITIGIFAIISVFTVLDSIERNIKTSISSLGDNIVYVQKWPWEFSGDYKWWKYINRPVPKLSELEDIMARTKKAGSGSFMISGSKTVYFEDNAIEGATMIAASHEYEDIRNFDIESGRYFSFFESKNGRPIAMLGSNLATTLFQGREPVGKSIKFMGHKMKVAGVFAREGQDVLNNSMDNVIFIPIQFARKVIDIENEMNNPMIILRAKDQVSVDELSEELKGIMRSIRRLKPQADDNFALNKTSMITKGFDSIFVSVKFASGFIGGFSILVGAFGIANIMFVTVKERTRLIGIQKAMGAKRYFILLQFLYEAIILSLIGGMLGLIFIFIGTVLASKAVDMDLSMTFGNVVTGLAISAISGVLSGIIPAFIASRLNPVDAMNSNF